MPDALRNNRKQMVSDKKTPRKPERFPGRLFVSPSRAILLDYLNFQKIKFNLFNPVVLTEFCFAVTLEICDVGIQPDRNRKVPCVADAFKPAEDLVVRVSEVSSQMTMSFAV